MSRNDSAKFRTLRARGMSYIFFKKTEFDVKKKWLESKLICLGDFLIISLLLMHNHSYHHVRWWLSMSSFLMFVTVNKYYSFRGSTYAADGIKPILVIWCSFIESKNIIK